MFFKGLGFRVQGFRVFRAVEGRERGRAEIRLHDGCSIDGGLKFWNLRLGRLDVNKHETVEAMDKQKQLHPTALVKEPGCGAAR